MWKFSCVLEAWITPWLSTLPLIDRTTLSVFWFALHVHKLIIIKGSCDYIHRVIIQLNTRQWTEDFILLSSTRKQTSKWLTWASAGSCLYNAVSVPRRVNGAEWKQRQSQGSPASVSESPTLTHSALWERNIPNSLLSHLTLLHNYS